MTRDEFFFSILHIAPTSQFLPYIHSTVSFLWCWFLHAFSGFSSGALFLSGHWSSFVKTDGLVPMDAKSSRVISISQEGVRLLFFPGLQLCFFFIWGCCTHFECVLR